MRGMQAAEPMPPETSNPVICLRYFRRYSCIFVLTKGISVVGPRSITFDELENFGADAALLCSVPGGITGLWQTSRRNEATFASGERQRIELWGGSA